MNCTNKLMIACSTLSCACCTYVNPLLAQGCPAKRKKDTLLKSSMDTIYANQWGGTCERGYDKRYFLQICFFLWRYTPPPVSNMVGWVSEFCVTCTPPCDPSYDIYMCVCLCLLIARFSSVRPYTATSIFVRAHTSHTHVHQPHSK